jgi:2-polyprenyl-3-methyl-5-hydroxy-6-metoxy-1,4-benzoquinol methylase
MTVGHECDLCGGTSFELLAERDRLNQPLATVVCRECGLVSHAAIPSRDELLRYYENKYRRDYHGEYTPAPFRVVREWKRGRLLLDWIGPHLQPSARVFEVGCGIGCTVMQFALAGHVASGIEPGEGFAAYARDHLNADVRQSTLYDLPPIPQYDLVLLVHVLEHLSSPTDALTRIGRLLAPSGKLYVEVPNFARPHSAPGRQFHFAHIYNYTPATLRMLAAKTGYRVDKAFTAPHDKVIGFLLAKSADAALRIERASYDQTVEAARRYSRLTYHMRVSYLLERALIYLQHSGERLTARWQLPKILEQCQTLARRDASVPVRRAA